MTRSFAFQKGVRQGCPLSPVLFILSLETLIRKVGNCERIVGFSMPGKETFKIVAYADDISVFFRNLSSDSTFLNIFAEYSYLSGALLNTTKCKVLRFGGFREVLPGDL